MKRKIKFTNSKFPIPFLLGLVLSFNIMAQNAKQVTGKVTDFEGASIPGVTVVVKGNSGGGTITNAEGNYSITVPEGSVLVFSFVGMSTQEVPFTGNTKIDVALAPDILGLDEVVIVGYGSQKKVNLTGAVSTVSPGDMATRPVTNVSAGLSGLAAGVQVTQNSGATAGNDGATIRIRGVGTMNNSNPLVVVDGVPAQGTGIMNDIDPNDIENISVLKDAASASIYGSRGANGVILITTKRGQSGKPRLTYNAYYGIQEIPRLVDYVSDFAEYMELANYIRPTRPIFSPEEIQEWRDNPNDPLKHPNVNWNEEVFGGTAPIMNHSLGYSGGTDKTQYRMSVNYLDQDGIVSGNAIQRFGVRTNISSEVIKNVRMGSNMFFRWSNYTPNNVPYSIEWAPSITKLRHPDGRWGGSQSTTISTGDAPYAQIANTINEQNDRRLLGDIFAEWEIIPGLKATAKLALNFDQGLENKFYKRYDIWNFNTETIVDQKELNSNRKAISSQYQQYQINSNLLLEYSKSFGNHKIKVMGGHESLQFRSDNVMAERWNFPNNNVSGIDAGLELRDGGGQINEWAMESYFARLNYNFQDKYMFEANIRADGSSRFKEGNRWGYFPSFSAGWNIAEESFMDGIEKLDLLKIRASWGQLGNNATQRDGRTWNYPYQPTYALNQNYSFNGQVYSGIAQTALTNQDIRWEETTTTNIGVDAVLYDGLSVTAEYFVRSTEGILTELPIPEFLGAKDEPIVNLASMENKGFEFTVGYNGSVRGDFRYNASANLTILENKVTDYFADIKTGGTQIGYAFDSFFGYEHQGIFKSQEEIDNAPTHPGNPVPGDLRLKDLNGDGKIGIEDRVIIGNKIPKYTFGANFGCSYKAFDFSMLVSGIAGRDRNTMDPAILPMNWENKGLIPRRWVNEEWNAETNPNGTMPNMGINNRDLNTGGLNQAYLSDFWVKDVSYVRLKNLQLGYDFSKTLMKSKNLSKLRVYVSGENLLTWTNEEWGFDPESNNVRAFNVRTITMGVNVGF